MGHFPRHGLPNDVVLRAITSPVLPICSWIVSDRGVLLNQIWAEVVDGSSALLICRLRGFSFV